MTSLDIAIVAEDSFGERNVRLIGDGVLGELPHSVEWRPKVPFKKPNTPQRFGTGRRFQGLGLGGDGLIIRKLVGALTPMPNVVVIARDIDRSSGRLDSLQKGAAAATRADGVPVVLAAMQPEAEAWRICSFVAQTPDEQLRHAKVRAALSFDPVREPTKLSSTSSPDRLRDTKQVHRDLFGDDVARSEAALQRPVAELRETARECGLAAFVDDFMAAIQQTTDKVG